MADVIDKLTICIDPGHGGHDPGALGPFGEKEADVVLSTSLLLRDFLIAQGFRVVMTRSINVFIPLSERADFSNSAAADFFLSLHCNSAERAEARGIEIFTTPGETAADPFATDIFQSVLTEFPDHLARKDLADGDPDKEAKFTVLTETRAPAALLEMEFIQSSWGAKFLSNPANQQRMALAIGRGIITHTNRSAGTRDIQIPDDLDISSSNLARARKLITEGLALLG